MVWRDPEQPARVAGGGEQHEAEGEHRYSDANATAATMRSGIETLRVMSPPCC